MKPNLTIALALTASLFPALAPAAAGPDGPRRSPVIERKLFVSSVATEARLEFETFVELQLAGPPDEALARRGVELQVRHLFGPMANTLEEGAPSPYYGVPKADHQIALLGPAQMVRPGIYRIRYRYSGTAVVQNGPQGAYPVVLPVAPQLIYRQSVAVGGLNPCTDPHYQGEGDFWYFWSPWREGCRMPTTAYQIIQARLTRLPNAQLTFPEYERLADATGTIRIDVLFGMDDPRRNGRNPMVTAGLPNDDFSAQAYRAISARLKSMGYVNALGRPWGPAELARVVRGPAPSQPYVEEFSRQAAKARIVVRLFFGPSGINEDSQAFHWFYKDALETGAVMVYDGHSGLGGHLSIPSIERMSQLQLNFNPHRYQILFFNSCSSYTYYNQTYFEKKRGPADPIGTKQLDILNNGLETAFSLEQKENLALVRAIQAWADGQARISYQQLVKQIDTENLFAVNGDEDNQAPAPPVR